MAALIQLALTFLRLGTPNELASPFPFPVTHAWHGFGCWRERLWFGDVDCDTRNDYRTNIDIAT
jgi:hypothetical protein